MIYDKSQPTPGSHKGINSFEDLEVWQMGKDIVMAIYGLTKDFPKQESFGLTLQMRKSALSVPANIAEGFGRYHYMDKAKFYLNARGSLYELKSHLLIAQELGYFNETLPVSHNIDKPGSITSLVNMIDNLSLKLNNLIAATRGRTKEPR